MQGNILLNFQTQQLITQPINTSQTTAKKAVQTSDTAEKKDFASVLNGQKNTKSEGKAQKTAQTADKDNTQTAQLSEKTDGTDDKNVSAVKISQQPTDTERADNKDEQQSDITAAIELLSFIGGYAQAAEPTENVQTGEIEPVEPAAEDVQVVQTGADIGLNISDYVPVEEYDVPNTDVQEISDEPNTDTVLPQNEQAVEADTYVQTKQTVQEAAAEELPSASAEQSDVSADAALELANIADNADVPIGDIVSVKYQTYNSTAVEAGKTAVEDIINSMFAKVPEEEAVQPEITAANTEEQTAAEVLTEPTVQDAQLSVLEAAAAKDTTAVKAEDKTVNVQTENVPEEISDAGDVEISVQSAQTDTAKENMSGGTQNNAEDNKNNMMSADTSAGKNIGSGIFSVKQNTESFKIYDADTSRNTAAQVRTALLDAMTDRSFTESATATKQMVLQLNPESLGRIVIKLQSTGDGVSVKLVSVNSEVREMLSAQLSQLTASIKEQGVNITNVEVANSMLDNNKEQSENNNRRQKENDDTKDDAAEDDGFSFKETAEEFIRKISGMV